MPCTCGRPTKYCTCKATFGLAVASSCSRTMRADDVRVFEQSPPFPPDCENLVRKIVRRLHFAGIIKVSHTNKAKEIVKEILQTTQRPSSD